MSSDHPVIRTNGLYNAFGHVPLPIGQRGLFVAAAEEATIHALKAMKHRDLVLPTIRRVVRNAVRFAYGTDEANFGYVSAKMANEHNPRLMESLLRNIPDIVPSA